MNIQKKKKFLLLSDILPKDIYDYALLQIFLLAFPLPIYVMVNGWMNMTGLLVERVVLLIFFFLAVSIGPALCRKITASVMITTLVLLDTADLFCFFRLHNQIEPSFYKLIETTTASECTGFIKHTLFHWSNLLLLYPLIILSVWIFCKKHRWIILSLTVFLAVPLSTVFFGIEPASNKRTLNYYDRIDSTLDFIVELEAKDDVVRLVNSNLNVTAECNKMTAVLIIGESHSKYHNQLYGYPRETSPRLQKRVKAGSLAVFTDAVAPHSFTIYSVPKLLTFAAHDRPENFWELANIFDLAKSAGFKTFWLCNHPAYADNGMPYSVITRRADVIKHSSPGNIQNYDETLLPLYRDALKDQAEKKLIVIQLLGSHHDYKDTYPEKWNHFPADSTEKYFNPIQKKNRSLVNAYHNSLRYNDYIIDTMISDFIRNAATGFVMYVPDHGENLYEQANLSMHMEFLPTRYSVEVPMYIALSNDHPEYANVFAATGKSFATEDLPYLIMDLSLIKYHGKDAKASLLSPFYTPKKRIVSRRGVDYTSLQY